MRAPVALVLLALVGPATAPTIASLTPASAAGSTLTLTIEGNGFDAASSVPEVYGPDGRLQAAGSVTARTPTRIVATVPLAGAAPGAYTVRIVGPGGARSKGAPLALIPEVSVSPKSGPPGTVFTYTGRGFKGSFGAISHLVRADGLESFQAKRFPTSAEGTFERPIDSGEFVPGTYTVWATDDYTKIPTARATFEVVTSGR
jgi:hypothetical protein